MKVQFELDEDLVKEAIADKLDDFNFDSEIESAIESAVADKVEECKLDENLIKEAIANKLDDFKHDSEIESAIESAVADKVKGCNLEDFISSNEILHAMLDLIQSQSFASGAQTERGNARVLGLSHVRDEARAVSTYCGFGPSKVLEIEKIMSWAPPLGRNVREMGELMTQVLECVGGTMRGGFLAGMLYAVQILESKDRT